MFLENAFGYLFDTNLAPISEVGGKWASISEVGKATWKSTWRLFAAKDAVKGPPAAHFKLIWKPFRFYLSTQISFANHNSKFAE